DFDHPLRMTLQPARAFALHSALRFAPSELHFTVVVREVAFVTRNGPGLLPFQTLPAAFARLPEGTFLVGVRHELALLHLAPSLEVGVVLPALVAVRASNAGQVLLVRGAGDFTALPEGRSRTAELEARAGAEWAVSRLLSATLWTQYQRGQLGPNG